MVTLIWDSSFFVVQQKVSLFLVQLESLFLWFSAVSLFAVQSTVSMFVVTFHSLSVRVNFKVLLFMIESTVHLIVVQFTVYQFIVQSTVTLFVIQFTDSFFLVQSTMSCLQFISHSHRLWLKPQSLCGSAHVQSTISGLCFSSQYLFLQFNTQLLVQFTTYLFLCRSTISLFVVQTSVDLFVVQFTISLQFSPHSLCLRWSPHYLCLWFSHHSFVCVSVDSFFVFCNVFSRLFVFQCTASLPLIHFTIFVVVHSIRTLFVVQFAVSLNFSPHIFFSLSQLCLCFCFRIFVILSPVSLFVFQSAISFLLFSLQSLCGSFHGVFAVQSPLSLILVHFTVNFSVCWSTISLQFSPEIVLFSVSV